MSTTPHKPAGSPASSGGQFDRRQGSAPSTPLRPPAEVSDAVQGAALASSFEEAGAYLASPYWQARAEVADNDHIGTNGLEQLAADPDEIVRMAVASRADSPVGRTLLDDPSPLVRLIACQRSDVSSVERSQRLADPSVRRLAVAAGVV